MKILQINSIINSGSTGKIAEEIGKYIISKGDTSIIAYGRNPKKSASKTYKIENKKGFYLHVLKSLFFDRHGLGSKNATINFIKYIEKEKPDIIHLHNIHGYYINYVQLFSFLNSSNIKVLWTLHDCWSFTGHCSFYEDIGCAKFKELCHNCPKTNKYPKSIAIDNSEDNFLLKKRYFSNSNAFLVTPSNWLAKEVSKSFLKKLRCNVIHNGLDLKVFKPNLIQNIEKNRKKTILGVANIWDKRKGLEDFIKLSEVLDNEYEIFLVGLSDAQIKELPKKITGIKRTESLEDLVKIYQDAFVFFNPTYQDNFPTTNIESLACGTPVITYNTGGSPEAIDINCGFVLEKGNYLKVPEILSEIKKNHIKYRKKSRERAETTFDKNIVYQNYYNLYKNILENE